ncbi:MAG: DUF4167 domain-containing protein [Rhodospirillaceae bacterium]|nr:DUF4167 domain-containing protein [Rhodospirillaceae bacterium]
MKGRQRGRNGGKPRMHQGGGGGGGRNPNFDHNAGRMRGNAQQLMDKFLALARDASSQGDRVLAENYFQHADHYYRVINARFEGQQNQQRRFNNGQPNQDRGFDGQDNQGNFQDYNSGPDLPPGPSQNLIPSTPAGDAQPHVQAQPQAAYAQQQYQQPPQQQQHHDDGDIGLPPQLFGNDSQSQHAEPVANSNAEPEGNGGGEQRAERGNRPRQGGRRRFGPRREGGQPRQAEPADAG